VQSVLMDSFKQTV